LSQATPTETPEVVMVVISTHPGNPAQTKGKFLLRL